MSTWNPAWTSWAIRVVVWSAIAVGLARWFEWSNLYHPRRELSSTPEALGLAYEEVWMRAEDGVVTHGWWIPREPARGAVVYFHGNGENIGDLPEVAAWLHRRGLSVLLAEYRGYGKSRGFTRERGLTRDARAAWAVAVERMGGDAEHPPVIVYGRSLGAAIAARLAAERPVRGVVLESPFYSTLDMARILFPRLPARWLVTQRFETGAAIARVTAPALIAHSPEDEVIPFEQGRAVYEAAASRKTFVRLAGGHNTPSLFVHTGYQRALEAFFDETLGAMGPKDDAVMDD
jgi:uncharacterized protein